LGKVRNVNPDEAKNVVYFRVFLFVSKGVRRNFFRVGQYRNFAYPFQVADDAMQMDFHKTLDPFYPIYLCWLNLNLLSEMFSSLRLSEMLFLFKLLCLTFHFFEYFLQISLVSKNNLRFINGRNNMSGEKTRKLDTHAKLFQAMK